MPSSSSSSSSSGPWSPWSDWSPCSRSCDGGVSFRRRHCPPESDCSGDDREDKICSMQACPAPDGGDGDTVKINHRTQQCEQFNDVPYEGRYFEWESARETSVSSSEVCQLVCRAKGLPDSSPEILVRMDRNVVDGTRCREDESLDVCVAGKCRVLGCDLELDSDLRLDRCGVCGGDGGTCDGKLIGGIGGGISSPPSSSSVPSAPFSWQETPLSECSAPCGGGYMMAHSVCVNSATQAKAHDDHCDGSARPQARMAPCNNRPCPPR